MLTNLLKARSYILSKICCCRISESTKLITQTIWEILNALDIIKTNITKQTVLINTNKTNLLLLLLL